MIKIFTVVLTHDEPIQSDRAFSYGAFIKSDTRTHAIIIENEVFFRVTIRGGISM